MDRRTVLRLGLLPSLVGLAATLLVYRFALPAAETAEARVPVVMARRAVPAKTRLTADMLKVEHVPLRYVAAAAVRDPAQAVGRTTLVPLAEGEMILSTRLAGEGSPAGLAYRIPDGYRAMSLKIDPVTAAGGFVQPGDRVDVVVVAEGGSGAAGRAVLLLERVLVLAVDEDPEAEHTDQGRAPDAYRYLTVAVTPEQALDLAVAQAFGRVHVLLRPATDGRVRGARLERTTAVLGR